MPAAPLLAQLPASVKKLGTRVSDPGGLVANDLAIVLAVSVGLVILLFLGAKLYISRKQSRRRRTRPRRRRAVAQAAAKTTGPTRGEKRRRRKARRNPTLAESGGLPPMRTDSEPPFDTPS